MRAVAVVRNAIAGNSGQVGNGGGPHPGSRSAAGRRCASQVALRVSGVSMNEILATMVNSKVVVVVSDGALQHVEVICARVNGGMSGWCVDVAVKSRYDNGHHK